MSALVELDSGRYHRVRPLCEGMGMHLAVESILAGRTAARMFVDDAVEPRAAMACVGHRVYLVGDVGGAGFREASREYASIHEQFVAYCAPEAIDGAAELFPGKVVKRQRFYYECDPTARAWAVEPPEGYGVERITEKLLERDLGHTDWVKEEMCSERDSVDEFLEKSFGFAAIHGEEFAAWCMSEYNLGDRCEVGIETVKEHRRRGLAALVAGAVFRHASHVGVRRVGWHCWADNAGSVATAERLGLRRVAEFPAFFVDARLGNP